MKRKTIAVCVSGFLWESENRIISGIKEICRARNINVLVFDSQIRKSDVYTTEIEKYRYILKGESEIFNLINYKLINGLILLSDTIFDKAVVQKIYNNCVSNNIPVVCANDLTADFRHHVYIDNENSMEQMVEHLITMHNCTKINFIGGMEDNRETVERLAAYKKVLEKYGIPVEEDRIGYGYFYKPAVDVTRKFLASGKEIEAIVCANDMMAVFVVEYLRKKGIKVPDQMIVTGYDGIKQAAEFAVPITTLTTDYEQLGIQCVNLLEEIEKTGIPEKSIGIKAKLVLRESCGCVKPSETDSDSYVERTYAGESVFSLFSTYLSQMNVLCASDEDKESLFIDLMRPSCLFQFKMVLLCICAELEKGKNYFYNDFKISNSYGFSKKLLSMVQFGHAIKPGSTFDTKQIIPDQIWESDEPLSLTFNPLYFKDKFLGYIGYEFEGDAEQTYMFSLWLQAIASNIGSFYERRELENMYMHDPLTNLYNRRGMEKMFKKTYETVMKEKGYLTMVCSDIDDLKKINDKFGHEAGDIAIRTVADALQYCLPKQSICVRTGGDEYAVLIYTKKKPDTDEYIAKLSNYFYDFNNASGLPFKVSSSCGFCVKASEENPVLSDMARAADAELYKAKTLKKS
ncbi:MAG: GGDEF domain-containing protein [Treponema sp.]|nr:GGDEF domain-containing protein [Candidatus Treponema caballi]